MPEPIAFNVPTVAGREFEYMRQAIDNMHLSGDGPFTKKCSAMLEAITGAKKALLTTSCTHALDMAAQLVDIQPGDEVIVPSFTFTSTANAFILRGATPVFIDIRPDTLNLDEKQLPDLISTRTKCIAPVHYAGVGCDMTEIMGIASRLGIAVVEDNAHGLCGTYKGQPLGSFGCLATLSFHETKNIICGEGGALLINDDGLIERAEIIREKGTNRTRFYRGEIDKYGWVDIGSSYLLSDLLAAFLCAQLERADQIQSKRREMWDSYHRGLQEWARGQDVQLPNVPSNCQQAYHMFYMLLPSLEQRQALIGQLKARDISAVFHYQPLHSSEAGQRFGGHGASCPVTDSVSNRLLRLPFHNQLNNEEQERIIDAILGFRC